LKQAVLNGHDLGLSISLLAKQNNISEEKVRKLIGNPK